MNICFLDGVDIPYTSNDSKCSKLRGAENVVINLSKELFRLGHKITVFNNVHKNTIINGVIWRNINNIDQNTNFDLAISNNDLNLFKKIKSKNI